MGVDMGLVSLASVLSLRVQAPKCSYVIWDQIGSYRHFLWAQIIYHSENSTFRGVVESGN